MLFITRNELKRMMDQRKDFVLIETRPADDFEREHIPGAINVPLNEPGFEERVREACPEVDRDVIIYGDGMESLRDAAMRLESLGYTSIYAYQGGKEDWLHPGRREGEADRPTA